MSPSPSRVSLALAAAASLAGVGALSLGCAHTQESQVVAAAAKPDTIVAVDTVDTQRIAATSSDPAVVARALAELIAAHFATVGVVRAPVGPSDVTVELPAPGWLLHAHIVMKPELFALVTLEPLAADKGEHAVSAAPWSVLDAYERVHDGIISLEPPKHEAMPPERFSRLRAEATADAAADRALTVVEYRRTPRPISDDPERPYYTPPDESSILKETP